MIQVIDALDKMDQRIEKLEADMIAVETYAEALNAVIAGAADRAALNFHVGSTLAQRNHPGRFALPETQEYEYFFFKFHGFILRCTHTRINGLIQTL